MIYKKYIYTPELDAIPLRFPTNSFSAWTWRLVYSYVQSIEPCQCGSGESFIHSASVVRFSTYWTNCSLYQSAFRRRNGSISTANVCIIRCCWMYPHESRFPLEYSDAQIAASQRINIINILIIHTQLRSGGLCTGCEVWRFHLLRTWQWSLITNIFAFLFPLFLQCYLRALDIFKRVGFFVHSICEFQSRDAPAQWIKKQICKS